MPLPLCQLRCGQKWLKKISAVRFRLMPHTFTPLTPRSDPGKAA